VATRRTTLEVEARADVASAECRKALRDLRWELSLGPEDRLVAREDLALLCCVEGPIQVDVRVLPRARDRSEVLIEASIVGRGPIQSKRLRDRVGGLERQILRKTAIAAAHAKV
jgi:hypothetical protein